MTTFLLIRHASGDHVGRRLAGRAEGAELNARGQDEARRLAERLAGRGIDAIYASPLARARATAAPLAAALGLDVHDAPAFTELDYGQWTGLSLEEVAGDDRWRGYNNFRSGTRIPGGELMTEVQARAVAELLRLGERHPDETVAIVSHGDVIRGIVCHLAGTPIDLMLRFEIDPASVTELELASWGARLVSVNERLPRGEFGDPRGDR